MNVIIDGENYDFWNQVFHGMINLSNVSFDKRIQSILPSQD